MSNNWSINNIRGCPKNRFGDSLFFIFIDYFSPLEIDLLDVIPKERQGAVAPPQGSVSILDQPVIVTKMMAATIAKTTKILLPTTCATHRVI